MSGKMPVIDPSEKVRISEFRLTVPSKESPSILPYFAVKDVYVGVLAKLVALTSNILSTTII